MRWPSEEALCRELGPRLALVARRRRRDSAEDLAQEALIVTLEAMRAGRIDAPENVAAFAHGVLKNLVRDGVKKDARREAALAALPPDALAPSPPAAASVERERLGRSLVSLEMRDREILIRTYAQGQDAAEIGAALGLSSGAVRVARHRAISKLRAKVEEEAP